MPEEWQINEWQSQIMILQQQGMKWTTIPEICN